MIWRAMLISGPSRRLKPACGVSSNGIALIIAFEIETQTMSTLTIKATSLARASYHSVMARDSANRRIFTAMMTVGALSVIVKLAATLKEVAFAHRFGASDQLDALLIAFLLPAVVMNIAAGSFNAALIPTYIEV